MPWLKNTTCICGENMKRISPAPCYHDLESCDLSLVNYCQLRLATVPQTPIFPDTLNSVGPDMKLQLQHQKHRRRHTRLAHRHTGHADATE